MTKHHICFLFNELKDYNFEKLLLKYLPKENYEVLITKDFPKNPLEYKLIIPWCYKKILKDVEQYSNVIIIHSSNLPYGRGWAPIYYTFKNKIKTYYITCILAKNSVDEGDIIAKISFPVKSDYTATFLREVDKELSLLLIKKILDKWPEMPIEVTPQKGKPTYNLRRFPSDNEIDKNNSIESLLPHLRGVEDDNPAFFFHDNVKFNIKIYPEFKPKFPDIIKIEYPALNEKEYWKKK